MSEYYGVIRSSDKLEHYGVKGMKWGVRKALKRGGYLGERKLDKQYRKATKKLARLNQKANVSAQKEEARKHNRRAAIALGLGTAGLSVYGGAKLRVKQLKDMQAELLKEHDAILFGTKSLRKKRIVGAGKGIKKHGIGITAETLGADAPLNAPHVYSTPHPAFRKEPYVLPGGGGSGRTANFDRKMGLLAAATTGAMATAAYQKGRAMAAKRRTTAKGHAKAVAKRDAWAREMNTAFKGTKYGNTKRKGRKSK